MKITCFCTTVGVRPGRRWNSTVRGAAVLLVAAAIAAPLRTGTASAADAKVHDKGVGPIKQVTLGPIDSALAQQGRGIFEQKCVVCHKLDQRLIGPPLRDVTKRMEPEWIMNMILNPSGMLENDPTAKELLGQYLTPMPVSGVRAADARALLEYLRQAAAGKAGE